METTVTGVDITDGVHRVHMTADIRLPETQPQEVPSPFVEPDTPAEGTTLDKVIDIDPLPGVVVRPTVSRSDPTGKTWSPPSPSSPEPAATLTFGGVTIGVDGDMLFLTDMWKAAGSDDSKKPAEWRRQDGTKAFIEYLETTGLARSLIKTTEGRNGGTWAHWQLGMAYAKYLSPSFHVWCNSVVRAHMIGRLAPTTASSGFTPPAVGAYTLGLTEEGNTVGKPAAR